MTYLPPKTAAHLSTVIQPLRARARDTFSAPSCRCRRSSHRLTVSADRVLIEPAFSVVAVPTTFYVLRRHTYSTESLYLHLCVFGLSPYHRAYSASPHTRESMIISIAFFTTAVLIRQVFTCTHLCHALMRYQEFPVFFFVAELIRHVFTRTYAYFALEQATDRLLTSHFCTRTLCPACFRYRCPAPYCFFVILFATHRLISMRLIAPNLFQRPSMLSITSSQSSF